MTHTLPESLSCRCEACWSFQRHENPEHDAKRQVAARLDSGLDMLGNDKDFGSAAPDSRADVEELKQNSDLLARATGNHKPRPALQTHAAASAQRHEDEGKGEQGKSW